MTDEAQVNAYVDCEHCGAVGEEPCKDDCPWTQGMVDHDDAYALRSTDESYGLLMTAIYQLPMNRLAGEIPDRAMMTHQEWASRLADWMAVYQVVLADQVDKLMDDSKRAIGLQIEKDVVRAFFGTAA